MWKGAMAQMPPRSIARRPVEGQAGELLGPAHGDLEVTEFVDEADLQRLLAGPDATLGDALDLLFGHVAALGDAALEEGIELFLEGAEP
jgi:hypothetical protein